ncbi:hypothetical protein IWQ60_001844 [Tieghemiomyces parasiticus]|uniref:Importin N-terminal domain-containing protein n=1 Tax=Tieghemiomyces parasiticus TaxID=78921 RepID=A0A9W8DW69_9FUNG|nr:hypothetical protein IWQ60_001844 [Tieghemiomyces parasiticus]
MDSQFLGKLLESLERYLGSNDTQEIREITVNLRKNFYNLPECVPALAQIALASGDGGSRPVMRQLAAVELRKRVSTFWARLPAETQQAIQQRLLTQVVADPDTTVRHSLAQVISAVAEIALPEQQWPELLPFLFELSTNADPNRRETGVYVLYTLFEVITDGDLAAASASPAAGAATPRQFLPDLFNLFGQSIRDPESRAVRVHTLRALGKVAEFLEPENAHDVQTFRSLVPAMVNVIEDGIAHGDEEGVGHGFDVFDSLLVLETPLLSQHFAELIRFFMTVAGNAAYPDSVRGMAMSFVSMSAMFKRNKLQKLKLVDGIIQQLFPIIAEGPGAQGDDDDDEDAEEDDDLDADLAHKTALSTLSALSSHLSPSVVFPPTLGLVLQYMSNPSPAFRRAAMMGFAVTIEWSTDLIASKVPALIELVEAGLKDPTFVVRRAACMALGAFAEHFDEEIAAQHARLLPLIFQLMRDPHPDVIKFACNALDAILEGMGSDVLPYLADLMQALTHLLATPEVKVKITVTAALGSAAHAAGGEAFRPYFDDMIRRVHALFGLSTADDDYSLRGIAIDTVGVLADTVGKETFAPHLDTFMRLAFEGLTLPSGRLRDCTFLFFGTISRVFGEDFAPYLEHVVPPLLASCRVDEGVQLADPNNLTNCHTTPALAAAAAQIEMDPSNQEEDLEAGSEDEEIESVDDLLQVNTAVADEKEVAADVLGELFDHTGRAFLPYTLETVNELVRLAEHDADNVRTAVVGALFKFLVTYHRLTTAGAPEPVWTAGLPLQYAVDPHLAMLIRTIMPAVMTLWSEEVEVSVVIQILAELSQALKAMGPALLVYNPKATGPVSAEAPPSEVAAVDTEANLTQLCNELGELLQKKAPCQEDDADEDNALDEEGQEKRDALLTGGAADVVSALCLALGPAFASYFAVFVPFITGYADAQHDEGERSMAVGCLGEAVSGLKEGVAPLTEQLYALFLRALTTDPDAEVRSNATFGMGVLIYYTPTDLTAQYPEVLNALETVYAHAEANPTTTKNLLDNAIGALARIALRSIGNGSPAVPLPQMVASMIRHLPLRNDYEENVPVYDLLCGLVADGNPAVQPHLAQLKNILQQVAANASEQLKPAQQAKVHATLQALN